MPAEIAKFPVWPETERFPADTWSQLEEGTSSRSRRTTELIQEDATKDATTDERRSRWKWNEEKNGKPHICLYDYKIKKDYEGKDMEADLVRLYEEIRQMMAIMYPPENFGPEEVSRIPEGLDDSGKVKYERFVAEEKRLIKVGYGRVKGRVKMLRQSLLLIHNWDRLVMIWGGCPSVTKIGGAVTSIAAENSHGSDDDSESEVAATDVEAPEEKDGIEPEMPCSKEMNICSSASTSSTDDQAPKRRKLSGKKRTKLEKPFSSNSLKCQVAMDKVGHQLKQVPRQCYR